MFDKEFDDPANIHLLVVVEIEKPSKPPFNYAMKRIMLREL